MFVSSFLDEVHCHRLCKGQGGEGMSTREARHSIRLGVPNQTKMEMLIEEARGEMKGSQDRRLR